uniref:Cytochrome P450 709B2-like n=1 Tax=Nelumbo nucifera TaxID=4432 RepID=A0A822Z151_NELNU|nr:TPA_asm: hypothetical protein HUJ06_009138 [Nelumbo nucifera]
MNMVLYETLRLYSPVIFTERKAAQDIKLGDLTIPKDTVVTFPFPIIHRNKKYWGDDADDFNNPLRFADGFSKAAKHPNALIAFSMGPRVCIGQNFAMLEAKIGMAMILQRFFFTLSPNYKHAPVNNILLQPQFGVPIILKPIHASNA